ncbi:MAG: hypothetical protein GEV11_25640 [Streptosporangiales bacterium]|nr:hypothetical protein [Streptosporangiales bacterium]
MSAVEGGPFTFRDAVESGVSRAVVRRLVESGEWTRLRRGIYVESWRLDAGDARRVHVLRVAAALLALNFPGAVCSHESAAVLHGIALLTPPQDGVTLTRPPGAPSRDRWGDVVIRRAALPPGHVCEVDGVPVTSPARTVVDLARKLPFRAAVVSVDSALGRRTTSEAHLAAMIEACRGWRGIAAATEAVAAANPRARSPLETLGRLMCAEAGLPSPKVGVYIGDDRSPYTEADLYWPEYGVIVLLDGVFKYNDPRTNRKEKLIQERLENDGFIVVRLTWEDITHHQARSLERIRQAFRRSQPRP